MGLAIAILLLAIALFFIIVKDREDTAKAKAGVVARQFIREHKPRQLVRRMDRTKLAPDEILMHLVNRLDYTKRTYAVHESFASLTDLERQAVVNELTFSYAKLISYSNPATTL